MNSRTLNGLQSGCYFRTSRAQLDLTVLNRSSNVVAPRPDRTMSRPTILPLSSPRQFAFGCVLMSPSPGLGCWTDRLYGVGVAGSAQGEFDLVTRLQLRKINRRSDREFHLHCRPVDGRDRTMIERDLVVRSIQGRDCAGCVRGCCLLRVAHL